MSNALRQIDLFQPVLNAYASGEAVDQKSLYDTLKGSLGLSDVEAKRTGGETGEINLFKRTCRWVQQTLKKEGLLERVEKGSWQITGKGKEQLSIMKPGYRCIAFSTRLGVAVWADAAAGADLLDEESVSLIITSPPYLAVKRNYGEWRDEREYIDFILEALGPYVPKLQQGAGVVINLGNDSFIKGQPARSMVVERLMLAIHDELELDLVERIPWKSNKTPGPTYWAFVQKVMLRSCFEHTFVFAKNAKATIGKWDNRRIREAHDPAYLEWCKNGGQKSDWSNSTYRKKSGDFTGTKQDNKLPVNLLEVGNIDKRKRELMRFARENGLPDHTATFPAAFASFFIRWITREEDLVVDFFSGTTSVGSQSEALNRRWFAVDRALEFHRIGAESFDEWQAGPGLKQFYEDF